MENTALIVAHGQPSDPAPAEADLARVAAAVAGHLPGWRVGSATLATPGALARTVADLGRPAVFPFFMADGWFIRDLLPRRLAEAGAAGLTVLPPFGIMAEARALAVTAATEAAAARGWRAEETVLVLAAHGSGRSPMPAEAARAYAEAARPRFREVRLGFIEEPPGIAEAARDAGERAVCLPLFVARWGHVEEDVPAALKAAGFRGVCLDPLGVRGEVPGIVAGAIRGAE